jgi:DNA-3-methyladenine glycosylase
MKKLGIDFYQRTNVLQIAKELLGKILVTKWDGLETSGRIVEVEAYNGVIDKASHASGGRRTNRNEVMYGKGGVAYVYLCYGIHHLFNVVTNEQQTPHAVLIRALEPLKGIDTMLRRTNKKQLDHTLTRGPGNVSKALGISFKHHSGHSLLSKDLFIAEDNFVLNKKDVASSPRIGVDYAGDDASLPYRFYIKGNAFCERKTKIDCIFPDKLTAWLFQNNNTNSFPYLRALRLPCFFIL